MARRILNRKDLRADYEAAERRKAEDEEVDEEEESDEDEDESEAAEGEGGEEADEEGDESDEEAPAKPKKKKPVKEPKPKRVRTPKVVRQKVVWGVFNNSNQRVATYEYPKKKEADEHAARMTAEKKLTFFVQPVKEPIEEKKD
jgi:hypothetical protein